MSYREEDEDLRNFQETLVDVTRLIGFLSNDEVFKKEHGFSMTEYISLRRSCANQIREVASSIERVVRDTGIAKTTGGSVAVVSELLLLPALPWHLSRQVYLFSSRWVALSVESPRLLQHSQLPSSKTQTSTKKRRK